jgi:hypothetical protein
MANIAGYYVLESYPEGEVIMNGPRKTLQERIEEEQKRQEESRAALATLKARARELDRKLYARHKILIGVGAYAQAKIDPQFREGLRKGLHATITRPQDRAILAEFFAEPPAETPRTGAAPQPPARPVRAPGDTSTGATPAAPEPPIRPPKKPGDPPSGAAPA